jgi:hypothetical protein
MRKAFHIQKYLQITEKNGLREVKILVLTQGIIINEDGLLRYFLMTIGKWFILPY